MVEKTARYELLDKLGEGGMGVVYEAYDRVRGVRLALKTLRNVNRRSIHRFKREFRALTNLSHPNIINLYELVADGDEWFLTMELVQGEDVISYVRAGRQLERRPRPVVTHSPSGEEPDTLDTRVSGVVVSGALFQKKPTALPVRAVARADVHDIVDLERLRHVFAQLADALHALHRANLVHRDLKPSNVLVTPGGRLVLVDFGVVADLLEADRDSGTFYVGTPQYMPPEQAMGARPSAAADWYAFGVLLYVALTGRLPYEGSGTQVMQAKLGSDPLPPRALASGIPADLEELCMELLHREPEARPSSHEVLARLGVLTALAMGSGQYPALEPPTRLFVGREPELATLRRAYALTANGASRCVLVRGRSGMGKSSLVDRFLWEVMGGATGPLVLSGRCHERESTIYKAFDGIIEYLAHHLLQLQPGDRRALLPADAALIARLFPAFQAVVGTDEHEAASIDSPIHQRVRAIAALRSLLVSLACERPLILRAEDLQWADRDSIELLIGLMQPPAPPGVMLVATLRADDDDAAGADATGADAAGAVAGGIAMLRAWGLSTTIELGPLTTGEQRELLGRMASLSQFRGVRRLDDGSWTATGGHPMLLVELARSVTERDDPAAAASSKLEDFLWERVARLPAPGRALVECIALAGKPLPLAVLGAAAGLSGSEAEQATRVLRVAHLARNARSDGEPWLVAYHDKVRETIAERMSEDARRAVHGRIGAALEAWGQASAATLADQWLAAGECIKAAFHRCRAARVAAEILAFDRAADLYASVLAMLPEGSGDREIEVLRCRACIGLAASMRVVDCNDDALAHLDSAQGMADAHGLVEELAEIHTMRGNLLFPRGDIAGCLTEHQKALDYARSAHSPEREALALSGLGDAHYVAGRMRASYEHFHACITLCRAYGFRDIEAANLAMRGVTRYYQNDLRGALDDGLDGAAAALRCGHKRAELVARIGCISWIYYEMGMIEAARRELDRALDVARAIGARRFEPSALAFLAKLAALEGRRDEAENLAAQAVAICRQVGMSFVGVMALGALARVAGDARVRRAAMVEAEDMLPLGAPSHNHLYFYRHAMDIALAQGDPDLVERYAQMLEDYAGAEPLAWARFFVERGRALAACLRGRGDVRVLGRLLGVAERAGLHMAARALRQAMSV